MTDNRIIFGLVLVALVGTATLLVSPVMPYNNDKWFGFLGEKEEEDIYVYVPGESELPLPYNGEDEHSNIKVALAIKNGLTYNHPAMPGFTVAIYEDETPASLAYIAALTGFYPNDGDDDYIGGYVDGGTTDSDGKWTSVVETFASKETYWLIMGGIATTNKSQAQRFIVQGQTTDAHPTSIYCGTFMYEEVTEEADFAIAWYDENYASLSSINLTSAAYVGDHVVDGFLKFTFSSSDETLGRKMWSSTRGWVEVYVVFVFTELNCTAGSAIDMTSSDDWLGIGTPTSKFVTVCKLQQITYQVNEDGDTVGDNKAVHWFTFQMDFSGCGITTTYAAATARQFSVVAKVGAHWNWQNFAASGTAFKSTWIDDTSSSIYVTI